MRRTRSGGRFSESPLSSSSSSSSPVQMRGAQVTTRLRSKTVAQLSTDDCLLTTSLRNTECMAMAAESDGFAEIHPPSLTEQRTPRASYNTRSCSQGLVAATRDTATGKKEQQQRQTPQDKVTGRQVSVMDSMWTRRRNLRRQGIFTSGSCGTCPDGGNLDRVLRSYYKKLFTDDSSGAQAEASDNVLKNDDKKQSPESKALNVRNVHINDKKRRSKSPRLAGCSPLSRTDRILRSTPTRSHLMTDPQSRLSPQKQDSSRAIKQDDGYTTLENRVVRASPFKPKSRDQRQCSSHAVEKMKRRFVDISSRLHDRVLRSYKCQQSNDLFFNSLLSTSSDSDLVASRGRRRVVFREPEILSTLEIVPEVVGKVGRRTDVDCMNLSDDELLEEKEDGQGVEGVKEVVLRWDRWTVVVLGVVVGVRLLYEAWSHNSSIFSGLGLLGLFGNKGDII